MTNILDFYNLMDDATIALNKRIEEVNQRLQRLVDNADNEPRYVYLVHSCRGGDCPRMGVGAHLDTVMNLVSMSMLTYLHNRTLWERFIDLQPYGIIESIDGSEKYEWSYKRGWSNNLVEQFEKRKGVPLPPDPQTEPGWTK